MIVLDASVLIALFDASDAHHAQATRIIADRAGERLVASALTVAESLVWVAGHGRAESMRDAMKRLGVEVVSLGDADVVPLAEVRASSRLRMPDAVVLHTALALGCDVATMDEQLAQATVARGLAVARAG